MELCNRFLTAKQHLLDNGEIVPRTFADYKRTTDRVVTFFGKLRLVENLAADDFESLRNEIAGSHSLVRLGGEIAQIKMVFKYGYDAGLIDRPMRYGPTFKPPAKHVLRKLRNGNGQKIFESDELQALLAAASTQMKAMILLGVNCGFGNNDCGILPMSALDLDGLWLDFPRPKTGIHRRCPLWTETVAALKITLEERPTPKNDDDTALVFITKYGSRWAKDTSTNPISAEFRKLTQSVRKPDAEEEGGQIPTIYRKGVGFYAFRHTFATIAGDTRDQVAVNFIMGHADNSMAAVYRERISDERLVAVTNHVRDWLFGDLNRP